jgi:hypothetical protein
MESENSGRFIVSSYNLNGTLHKMLHLQPNFKKTPNMYNYEISGTNGYLLEGCNTIIQSKNKNIVITFECKPGETYFCKVIAFYGDPCNNRDVQAFRLFYRLNDDFNEDDENDDHDLNISKLRHFRSLVPDNDDKDDEDDEEEEEDEDDDDDDDDDKEDNDNEEEDDDINSKINRFSFYNF